MPNQRHNTYKVFSVKLVEDEEYLEIKLGDTYMWHQTRKYRIKLRNIINTYIEGPFGGYDEANHPHDNQWRIVITVSRVVEFGVTEVDIVMYMLSEQLADELHSALVDVLNC